MLERQGAIATALEEPANTKVIVRYHVKPGPDAQHWIGVFTAEHHGSAAKLHAAEYFADGTFHMRALNPRCIRLAGARVPSAGIHGLLAEFSKNAPLSLLMHNQEVVCAISSHGAEDMRYFSPGLTLFIHLAQLKTALQCRTDPLGDRLLENRIDGYLQQNLLPLLSKLR